MITEETARAIAAAAGETFAVPTMAVLEQVVGFGAELGMFPESMEKAREVHAAAYRSFEYLYRNGARIGFGTDLFEERFHPMQSREFEYRADIVKPVDLLRSATSYNAEIMLQSGQLGCIREGAFADIIAIDGDPLKDVRIMAQPDRYFAAIMKGGVFVRERLSEAWT
jgi:imidazolonepropionase-like amidohydrolase